MVRWLEIGPEARAAMSERGRDKVQRGYVHRLIGAASVYGLARAGVAQSI